MKRLVLRVVRKLDVEDEREEDEVGEDDREDGHGRDHDLHELNPDFSDRAHKEKQKQDIEDAANGRGCPVLVGKDPNHVNRAR